MSWSYIWNRLKAIPAGVWAALSIGVTLLGMYLRGRRLEAKLAEEKLKAHAADAAAKSAQNEGRAQVHMERADRHAANVEALQDRYIDVTRLGKDEQARIEALPPNKVTAEYLKLAAKDKPDA